MADNVIERVRELLLKGGFPLEMRTARTFLRHGLNDVQQSEFYTDPDTGKPREVDVVVSRTALLDERALVSLTLVVECKTIQDSEAWVAFPQHFTVADHFFGQMRAATKAGERWLSAVAVADNLETLEALHPQWRPAYGIAHLGGKQSRDQDKAYEAMSTAAKAAASTIKKLDADDAYLHVAVAFPVVVVAGALVEATLEANDKDIALREVEHAQVLWRNPVVDRRYTVVDVLAEDGVLAFAEKFSRTAEEMLRSHSAAAVAAARETVAERGPQIY